METSMEIPQGDVMSDQLSKGLTVEVSDGAKIVGFLAASAGGTLQVVTEDGKVMELAPGDPILEGYTLESIGGGQFLITLSDGTVRELVLEGGSFAANATAMEQLAAVDSQAPGFDTLLARLPQSGGLTDELIAAAQQGPAQHPAADEGRLVAGLTADVQEALAKTGMDPQSPEFQELLAAVESGEDITEILEAPAAGDADAGPATSESIQEASQFARVEQRTTPTAGIDPDFTSAAAPEPTADPSLGFNAVGPTGVDEEVSVVPGADENLVFESGQPFSGNVTDNDDFGGNGPGSPVVVAVAGSPGNVGQAITGNLGGTILINGDGSYLYSPPTAVDHSDDVPDQESFSYTIQDAEGNTSSATITLDIADTEPVAVDDSGNTTGNNSVTVNVVENDNINPDGVDLANGVALAAEPTRGSAVYNGDGTFTYTPNPGESGSDSFTYTITDSDGDVSTATVNLAVGSDSTPIVETPDLNEDGDTVWESALPAGSSGLGTTVTSGILQISTGSDSLVFIEVRGEDGNWLQVNNDVTTVEGQYGVLSVNTDGSWNYELNNNTLDHGDTDATDGDGDRYSADQVQDLFQVRVTDSDGDRSAPADLTIDINDDGPVVSIIGAQEPVFDDQGTEISNDTGASLEVDETNLNVDASADFSGLFQVDYGADGPGAVQYSFAIASDGTDSGLVDVATGESLLLRIKGNGVLEGFTADSGHVAFTVEVDDEGIVTLNQQRALSHGNSADPDDAQGLSSGTIGLVATATDGDGDQGSESVDIGGHLIFRDDGPSIAIADGDPATVAEGETLNGTWTMGEGADGAAAVVTWNGGDYSLDSDIDTGVGTLRVNADGTWSFAAADGLDQDNNPAVDFSVTVTDSDGDSASDNHSLSITDANVPTGAADTANAVDEEGLDGGLAGGSGDVAGESASVSGTLSYDIGGDGAGGFAWNTAGLPAITAGGQAVSYSVSGDGQTLTANNSQGTVFTLSLTDLSSGAYSFTLAQALDHPAAGTEDNIDFSFGYTLTDADGSAANGTLAVSVDDDTPVVDITDADPATVTEGETLNGTWTMGEGADGGTTVVNWDGGDYSLDSDIDTGVGTLRVNADGTWSFAAADGLDQDNNPAVDFSVTVTDSDGDSASDNHSLSITDANVPTGAADTANAVDEEGLDGGLAGGSGDVAGESASVSGTLSYDIGGDGAGGFAWNTAGLPAITAGGQAVSYSVSGDGQTLTANNSQGTVFTLSLTDLSSGAYSFTLAQALDHPAAGTEDNIDFSFGYTLTDADGSAANGTLAVSVDDDTPVIDSITGDSTPNSTGATASGQLVGFAYGADQAGEISLEGSLASLSSSLTALGGQQVNYYLNPNDSSHLLASVEDNRADAFANTGTQVFEITANDVTGEYDFTLFQPLETFVSSPIGSSEQEATGPTSFYVLGANTGNSLAILSGYNVNNFSDWMDGNADPETDYSILDVNGSLAGWGIDNNNYDAMEVFRLDFDTDRGGLTSGEFDDELPPVNAVTVQFDKFSAGDVIHYVGHLSDGSTEKGTYTVTDKNAANNSFTFAAPEGTYLDYIEFAPQAGASGKFVVASISSLSDQPVDLDFNASLIDSDGDGTADSAFTITVGEQAGTLMVGTNADDTQLSTTSHLVSPSTAGEITGAGGDDILVGDAGGSEAPAGTAANLILVLDTSGSMDDSIAFDNGEMSRMDALKQAVTNLLNELSGESARTVRVHIQSFANTESELGTFDLVQDGAFNEHALNAAISAVESLHADGGTNYEAGLQGAIDWVNAGGPATGDNVVNQTIFVSDGVPTYYYGGNGTNNVYGPGNAFSQTALDHILGEYDGRGADDDISEVEVLESIFGPTQAVGINVAGANLQHLSVVEGEGGQAESITTAEQLSDVLASLNPLLDVDQVGGDELDGGNGDDIIFGDTINTDQVAADQGLSMPDGAGWAVFDALENGESAVSPDWSRSDTVDYIRANYETLGQPTLDGGGNLRAGGNDRIDGGQGNDIIFGQEGNDIIDGGQGNDLLSGGPGDDMLRGGQGDDIFLWNEGESGQDIVADFELGSGGQTGDVLDLADLLQGEDDSNLDDYLSFEYDSATITTKINIDVEGDGSAIDQRIELQGVDLVDDGAGGHYTDAQIIDNLVASGQLNTDS